MTTYKNPILTLDFSDPDVIRVGEDYYLTASSFNMVPGLPILHSRDLVHWRRIGYALSYLPSIPGPTSRRTKAQLDYDQPRSGCGVYAPSLRFHDDKFWIFWGDPDAGVYFVTATDAAGPWSDPELILEQPGIIDPSPFWDEKSGKAYLSHAYAASRAGIAGRIDVREMKWDGTGVVGEPKTVYDVHRPDDFPSDRLHKTIEGTKFMQVGAWYYILCPAGGVQRGWQTAMRSKDLMGPYEIRTVCETGSTNINGPHQGGLVDTPEGEWWFIHFQDTGTLGRICWLEPSHWKDGWPVIGVDDDGDGIGNPVLEHPMPHPPEGDEYTLETSDDFQEEDLGLQWQWPANPRKDWFDLKEGQLHLYPKAHPNWKLEDLSNILNQMLPGYRVSASTLVELSSLTPGVAGGLVAMGTTCSSLSIESISDQCKITMRQGEETREDALITAGPVWLRLETRGELPLPWKHDEDGQIHGQFSYSLDGGDYRDLGPSFSLSPGRWIGARLGVFCLSLFERAESHLVMNSFTLNPL